jgi:hypothetical protein
MLHWRSLLVLLGLTLAVVACGGGGGDDQEDDVEGRVLEMAAIYAGDLVSQIPFTDDYYDCTIHVRIVPEPPASPLRDVAGRCLWTVEKQSDTAWIVTFRETWFCSDWAAEIEGYPECDGLTGFHEWEYFVDLTDNGVNLLDDRGQFAPDMAPGE